MQKRSGSRKSNGKPPNLLKKRRASNPLGTRSKILHKSILLFNRRSVQTVSVKAIARHLKISTGNLTYHFPRKRDLIRAALNLHRESIRMAFVWPGSVEMPRDAGPYMVHAFRAVWNFRFFFNSLGYLTRSDLQLRRDYDEFREWLLCTMEDDLAELQKKGHFRLRAPPNALRLLVENIWNLWLAWLRMAQIKDPLAAAPTKEALADALVHHWSLLEPWMEPEFARGLLEAFEESNRGDIRVSRRRESHRRLDA